MFLLSTVSSTSKLSKHKVNEMRLDEQDIYLDMSRGMPAKRHLQILSQHFCITVKVFTYMHIERFTQVVRAFRRLKKTLALLGGSPDCLKSSSGLGLNLGN